MKLLLWVWTVIGILPILVFAALHVYTALLIRHSHALERTSELGENEFVITTSTLHFVGTKDPVVIATSTWPGMLCLCGIAMTIAGLLFLIPKQPLRIRSGVYERLPALVDRVIHSRKPYASMIMSSRQGKYSILLSKRDERVEISLSGDNSGMTDLTKIRDYFVLLGIEPTEDFDTREEEFDITTTHLAYDITETPEVAAETCVEIFRDIYSISSDELFQFDIND